MEDSVYVYLIFDCIMRTHCGMSELYKPRRSHEFNQIYWATITPTPPPTPHLLQPETLAADNSHFHDSSDTRAALPHRWWHGECERTICVEFLNKCGDTHFTHVYTHDVHQHTDRQTPTFTNPNTAVISYTASETHHLLHSLTDDAAAAVRARVKERILGVSRSVGECRDI